MSRSTADVEAAPIPSHALLAHVNIPFAERQDVDATDTARCGSSRRRAMRSCTSQPCENSGERPGCELSPELCRARMCISDADLSWNATETATNN
jgi:hypothetical protein